MCNLYHAVALLLIKCREMIIDGNTKAIKLQSALNIYPAFV